MMELQYIQCIPVAQKNDVINYMQSNTGRISPVVLVVYGVTCSLICRIQFAPDNVHAVD